ncbi:histidine phosphatase family protein [Streptomyces sp. NBC_00727]|uniref:histidine phosphatase family protein n=1 Tax=Streptomyces sp. NBC_00727 TaxID=2903675 RepID=UPI003863132F
MPVRIVYESHATTTDNEAGIATGWLPGRLSATGRRQAAELGDRRRGTGLDAVCTSDLARAVETARIAFAGAEARGRLADQGRSGLGVWCGASQGAGAASSRSDLGVSATPRGAVPGAADPALIGKTPPRCS